MVNFGKQHDRAVASQNNFYNQFNTNQMVKNIELDYSREEREKQIEDKKKNRSKNRHYFSSLQRMFRKGKRINEVKMSSKYLQDGVAS